VKGVPQPKMTKSKPLGKVSAWAERTYWRLREHVDSFGRQTGAVKLLKPLIYETMVDHVRDADLERYLAELEGAALIRIYTVDGDRYLQMVGFQKRIRAKASRFPDLPTARHLTDTCPTGDGHMSVTPSLSPVSPPPPPVSSLPITLSSSSPSTTPFPSLSSPGEREQKPVPKRKPRPIVADVEDYIRRTSK